MVETAGHLSASDGKNTIAWRQQSGQEPTILFLHGFRSDMNGTKAEYLSNLCRETDRGFLRLDYRGHGQSSGHYTDFTIGDWVDDVLRVVDQLTTGPLIVVGSSLGGWLGLRLLALRPARVRGYVAVAPAPDFPTQLVLPSLTPAQRAHYEQAHEVVNENSGFAEPTRFTRRFIEESAAHNCLHNPPAFTGRVRLFQGLKDDAVPWQQTTTLLERWDVADAQLTLFKDGDHRLNETAQLKELGRAVAELSGSI